MDAIGNALKSQESGDIDVCDVSPSTRWLKIVSQDADPRRLVDYQPCDVDDALQKLLYFAAVMISRRAALTASDMETVLKSVENLD